MIEKLEPRRLLAAGDIDTSFGTNGRLEFPEVKAYSPDSAIVPAGQDQFFVESDGGILKIDADGSPIAAFGDDGRVGTGFLRLMRLQPDGKILLIHEASNGDPLLQRLNADGSADTSFNSSGVVNLTTMFPDNFGPLDIVTQSSGKIVCLISDLSGWQIVRLNADGSRDQTFTTPQLTPQDDQLRMLRLADDKLLVGGWFHVGDRQDVSIMRLTADGTIDTTFGNEGFVSHEQAEVTRDFALLAGGGGSFVTITNDRTVYKFSANGTRDLTFGGAGGVADTRMIQSFDNRLIAMPDGKIVAFNNQGMVRLNADGTIDPTFLRFSTLLDEPNPVFHDAAVTSNGDIIAAATPIDILRTDLIRVLGSGSAPGPVAIDGATLRVAGTEQDERLFVRPSHINDVDILIGFSGQFGRAVERAGLGLMSIAMLGGNDHVDVSDDLRATVSGGAGSDTLIGGDGDDSLSGNAGRDIIFGGGGNDRVAGNGGRDRLNGGAGNDIALGGAGNDTVYSDAHAEGTDILRGDDGDDLIIGGAAGVDTIAGGDGDDTITASDGNAESIFGDAGNDTATADENDILAGVEVVI